MRACVFAVLALGAVLGCSKEETPHSSSNAVEAPAAEGSRANLDASLGTAAAVETPTTEADAAPATEPTEVLIQVEGLELLRLVHEGETVTLLAQNDEVLLTRGRIDELAFVAVIDLEAERRIPTQGMVRSSYRASSMKRPVAVITMSSRQEVDPGELAELRRRSRRATGIAGETELLLFDLRSRRVLWSSTIRRSSPDGDGGFEIQGLRIEGEGSQIFLRGTRQDRLPAHRARCLRPEPIPLEYRLVDGRFRSSGMAQASAPCR